jgi:hypothetical protein
MLSSITDMTSQLQNTRKYTGTNRIIKKSREKDRSHVKGFSGHLIGLGCSPQKRNKTVNNLANEPHSKLLGYHCSPSSSQLTFNVCNSFNCDVLQIGRSLVRSQLVSLEFFIGIKSFRSHYGPGVDSASNRNEYQEYFLGVKAAGA